MPFSSEVFRSYRHNFGKNDNNFGSYAYIFRSYGYKCVRNFAPKMAENGRFQGVKMTLFLHVFTLKHRNVNLLP